MDNDQIIRELRSLYPAQPIRFFMQILQRVGLENHQRLRDELGAAEQQTLRCLQRHEKKESKRAAAAVKALKKLEIHRALRLNMKLPVPVEHVQLVIVYGFFKFGSKVVFAEKHKLTAGSVRKNLTAKFKQIGTRLDQDEFNTTLSFLIAQDVVLSDPGKEGALSLNFDERGHVTATGKVIIKEMKRFFHELFKK